MYECCNVYPVNKTSDTELSLRGKEICVDPQRKLVPYNETYAGYAVNCPGSTPDYQICTDSLRCQSLGFRCCLVRKKSSKLFEWDDLCTKSNDKVVPLTSEHFPGQEIVCRKVATQAKYKIGTTGSALLLNIIYLTFY